MLNKNVTRRFLMREPNQKSKNISDNKLSRSKVPQHIARNEKVKLCLIKSMFLNMNKRYLTSEYRILPNC